MRRAKRNEADARQPKREKDAEEHRGVKYEQFFDESVYPSFTTVAPKVSRAPALVNS